MLFWNKYTENFWAEKSNINGPRGKEISPEIFEIFKEAVIRFPLTGFLLISAKSREDNFRSRENYVQETIIKLGGMIPVKKTKTFLPLKS